MASVVAPPTTACRACRVLGFDTATEWMSLALATPQGIVSQVEAGGAQASVSLIPALLRMLNEAGESLASLDAIAYGRGPGAFTGLRTACSVAQGLALGTGRPVIAVDSLMLVAEAVRHTRWPMHRQIWVAQDARMDEVYAAAYRWVGEHRGRWQTVVAPALYGVEALNRRWAEVGLPDDSDSVVTGSALQVMGDRLVVGRAERVAPPVGTGRARALIDLALMHWEDGDLLEAADALPLYLRDKVALTTAEREVVRAAKEAAR
jgi:tRNA threonylcarbamoyladenosine biosynthesis protein TsaB